jgi:carboxymethylenebutenolidase
MRAAAMVAGHGFVVVVPEIYHDIVEEGWVGKYDTAGADRGNELKITKTIESYDSGKRDTITLQQDHYLHAHLWRSSWLN